MPTRQRLGSHQAVLYTAEDASISKVGRRWSRVRDAQAYLDELIGGDWFGDRWPHLLRCTIERRGAGSVWSASHCLDPDRHHPTSEGVILVSDKGLTEPVLLHELAHLLAPPDAGHGPPFAQVLLDLVRHQMGVVPYAELLHALRQTDAFRDLPA